MAESSTRILLDRSVIRLDGRPFFAIGTRILLTPAHRIEEAVAHIASNGFNTVITPPTSLGTLPLIDLIFDAAERHGLMVIVATEPFDPEPSAYLARSFRHRQSLHSYCIPTPGDTREALLWYFRERDRLRTQDLFHPIWTPFRSGYPMALWLESSDLYAVQQGVGGPLPRAPLSQGAETLDLVRKEITAKRAVDRPFICHRFQASISDEARRAGLFDSDPVVRHLPAQVERWFPFLANLADTPRSDFLPPDADLLRVRVYEVLAQRVRGLLADCYEFLLGPPPTTGRDRLAEFSLIAREIQTCPEFYSEGRFIEAEVETGHPRLRAALLAHGDDVLMLLWRSAQGDEYWIDPSRMHRVEVSLSLPASFGYDAWRIDFPSSTPVSLTRDGNGSLRLRLQSIDISARVLLTSSRTRIEEIEASMRAAFPQACSTLIEGTGHRLEKIGLVESELAQMAAGQRQEGVIALARHQLDDARALLEGNDSANAWELAQECRQTLRGIVNNQMVSALSSSARHSEGIERLELLRHSYFTLPTFYRESSREDEKSLIDYT